MGTPSIDLDLLPSNYTYGAVYVEQSPSSASGVAIDINIERLNGQGGGMAFKYQKYAGMYGSAMSTVDKIQQFRNIDRVAILKGAIFDTGNPSGTAINLALNAKTIADKNVCKRACKEWGNKTMKTMLKK